MQEALTQYLLASTGLTAIVGQRITWNTRGQGAPLPAITLHTIDDLPGYVMSGPDGLASARIQIDCWGQSYANARLAARHVKARLSGMDVTVAGESLRGGFFEGDRESFERSDSGESVYRVSLDVIVWHSTE